MILVIAVLKALLTLIVFVAFAVIVEQIMDRARPRVSTALYLCFISLIPVTIIALELSWRSTRPLASLVQFGVANLLILIAVVPAPPELMAQIRRRAVGPTANIPLITRPTLHGTHIKRSETLIHLAIIGCVLTAYFAKISDETIPLLVSSIAIIAAMTANTVIHHRLRERAGALKAGMDL
jgi:uncharacterized membrane protein YoaK (UPF0700 family)